MSWEVEHAYWHFWQPGQRVDIRETDTGYPEYRKYQGRARRANSTHRLLLLRLAMDAHPVRALYGESEQAFAWTAIETLMEALNCSRRTVQRLTHELEQWGDLDVISCSGRCLEVLHDHHGTNHYLLPLPTGAQPWGRKERRHLAKTRKRRTSKK